MNHYNHISKKKETFPINNDLLDYLKMFSRTDVLPIEYADLQNYTQIIPSDTESEQSKNLWNTVLYPPQYNEFVTNGLIKLYQLLNANGRSIDHLYIGNIEFCNYGNSKPFRIKVINEINDNHDYFYVKKADASRVYGLELEHILSPNKINYLCSAKTLIEEHIIGIPGDLFIKKFTALGISEEVRLAKEFVKFNERCFVRLLGDMRAYNYVVVLQQDFDKINYRLRAMDFDQQSYEKRKNMYLPQFFKGNYYFVKLVSEKMNKQTILQYQQEERSLLKKRLLLAEDKYNYLIKCMKTDTISIKSHINQLKSELNSHHNCSDFNSANNMGEILDINVRLCLE